MKNKGEGKSEGALLNTPGPCRERDGKKTERRQILINLPHTQWPRSREKYYNYQDRKRNETEVIGGNGANYRASENQKRKLTK